MGTPLRVLIVDESIEDAETVLRLLRRASYDPVSERVQTAAAMKAVLERETWDLVVSDHSMSQLDAATALNLLRQGGRDIPFIVVSGHRGEDAAVALMKAGAHDYILKENPARLGAAAIQNAQLYQEARRISATLAANEVRLRQLSSAIEQTADAVLITDRDGVIQYVNAAFEGMTGHSAAEAVGRKPSLLKSGQHPPKFFEHLWRTITAGAPFRAVFVNRRKNGTLFYEEQTITPIRDQGGNITHFVSTAKDITEQRQAERQSAAELRVLELLAHGAPLSECLDRLARECEALCAGMICSVLLLDADGRRLRHGAAPSLPADYVTAIDGIEIGPGVGSCGTAAHTGRTVIVSDIATDPLWADGKGLALAHGLRACWSVPILGEADRVLGALALYSRESRAPPPAVLATHERAAHLASLAILRHHDLDALRQSEARFRGLFQAAPDAILIVNRQRNITLANPAAETVFGYGFGELSGRIIEDLVSGSARQRHVAHYEGYIRHPKARPMGSGMDLQGCRKDGTEFPVDVILAPLELSGEWFTLCIARDITARKQAEDENRRLGDVLEASLNEIYIFDAQTLRFEYANAAALHNLGYAMDAMRTMTPLDLKPEFSAASFGELIGPLRRHEKAKIVFQTVHRRADGSLYPVEVHLQFVERGGRAVFLAVINDITARKQADDALRRSEARLQEAQRVARLGNWDWDITTNDLYWSEEIYRIFGLPPQFGTTYPAFLQRVHPLDRSRVQAAVGAAVHAAAPYDLDHRIVLPDGRERTVHETGLVFRDETGRPLRMVGTVQDITERAAATAQIREQADLLNMARDAIIVTGLDNRITFWSHGAERITGWPAPEVLGKSAEQLFGTAATALAASRETTMAAGAWHGEIKLPRKDGQLMVLDLRLTLIRDEAGQPKSRLGIGTDITEKKQLEEHTLRTQRFESLGMIAAGIAHDFNNILAPLVMGLPLLKTHMTNERERGILATFEKCGTRGTALVQQILSFASGVSGGTQLLQARHVLREVAELAESTFPKSIRFGSDLPGDLWPVTANAGQLHQVFLNLCINARDAMPEGGSLRLRAENRRLSAAAAQAIPDARPGAFLMVEVEDTGTGIPAEILERIWEPFFTTKAPGKGTGLGLATVRALVHQHGGFIALQSRAGHGTVFSVFLPAAGTGPDDSLPPFAPPAPPRGNGECILVVDDEDPVRDMVALMLEKHGYRVLTACDGAEAVTVFAAHADEVQLLLTDLQMPLLGGPDLAAALHRIRPGLPIIAMSGAGSTAIRSQPPFASAFIPKPFTLEILLPTVHEALHRPPSAPPGMPRA